MNLVPFPHQNPSHSEEQVPAPSSSLVSVRLKEIVPLYQNVEIRCAVSRYLAEAPAIHSAEDVAALFAFLQFETRETFFALHLDNKNRILCLDQVSVGSLTASIVHPREVFKSALVSSAAGLVFVHNHPSGDPTPSREDYSIQQRLAQAGELLGIRVLDHLIIGDKGRYISMTHGGFSPEPTPEGSCAEEGVALFV